ncbi:MAG: hypothetical protein ACRCY4_06245, partial [Brevinema sp.]
ISQNFLHKGQFITLNQRVYSKYWQPAIPRVFYVTPSFKIVNTPVEGSQRQAPEFDVPLPKRPYLNGTQRYILSSIENLRATQQKAEFQLFDDDGNRTYKPSAPKNKAKVVKPFLANRKFSLNVDTNTKPELNLASNILAELDGTARRNDNLTPVQSTNNNTNPPAFPLQSSLPASEHLAQSYTTLWDIVFPLSGAPTEVKAQAIVPSTNTNANITTTNATTNAPANNTNQASTNASETNTGNKKAKKTRRAPLSVAEQLQQTEDKIQEAKEKKFSKDQAAFKKASLRRRYFPSNEGEKLKDMLGTVIQRLKDAPYFTTNDLQAVTNRIPPFELETDPATYRSERKKYYSVTTSTSRFKKSFVKETKNLKAALSARIDDELYWANLHREMLIENNRWTPSMETQHSAFKKQHLARKKLELTRLAYHRDRVFNRTISNEIRSYFNRSTNYAPKALKPEQVPKTVSNLQKQMDLQLAKSTAKYQAPAYEQKKQQFEEQYKTVLSNFTVVSKAYTAQKPRDLRLAFLQQKENNPVEQINENRAEWTALAQRNSVPLQLVAFAEISKKKYPTKSYRQKMTNIAMREYKKNMRFVVYEGYIFGLSGSWRIKTSLADRMDSL